MSITLERTFHPVGHGAFFTECFDSGNGHKFNVVYDCGTNSPKQVLDNAINKALAKGTAINVVFVSHLDKDHINGIKVLAANKNLTNRTLFVMPLFSKEVYVLAYLRYGSSFIQMFRAISKVGCSVLFVDHIDNERDQQADASIDLHENRLEEKWETTSPVGGVPVKTATIQSGTRLKYLDIWEYVPFNPSGADAVLFQQELRKQQIQLDLVLNALRKTRKSQAEKNELEKVKSIYKKVTTRVGKDSNKLNISSLVLLSHKSNNVTGVESLPPCPCFYHPYFCWDDKKSACLYTGDTDLSTRSVYYQLMKDVMRYQGGEGLRYIQIPHHGSRNNYSDALCKDMRYNCAFTNYGINYHQNIFDSRLIMEYLKQGRPLALITEYPQTILKEIVFLNMVN